MTVAPMTQDRAAQAATLAQAHEHHRAGRLAEAVEGYRTLALADPNFLPAIHGLGLATFDLGWPERAVPLLARCVAAAPEDVDYRCSFGMVLLKTGHPDAAATALLPAANASPVRPTPRLLLAHALGDLGRWQEAYAVMVETSELFPEAAEIWSWRGVCARECDKLDDAEDSLNRAAALRPGDPDILNNLGVALRARGKLGEAVAAYRLALDSAPNSAMSHSNLGNALDMMGDPQGAELHLRRALALAPDFVDGLYNFGAHLARDHRPDQAIPYLRRVVAMAPQRWDALTGLGVSLVAMGETTEAENCYRQAIALKPGNAEAHYDLAWVLLLTGRWPEGWAEYEWRWQMPSFSSAQRGFTTPVWDGNAVSGTLVIHAEQGLGDAIQFVRYARLAALRCDKLIIEAPRALTRLFTHATSQGLLPGEIIPAGQTLPSHAAHAAFMSLPGLFGTTPASVPVREPYLASPSPPPHLHLPDHGRRKIGLVWAGSPDNRIDRERSMAAVLMLPLFEATTADIVSLQVGPAAAEAADFPAERVVLAVDGKVQDFADTAAVLAQLDLVIGVDTASIHLAGALGTPAWILLPFAPDYRWLQNRADTPWYPSMRLFRQDKRGNWEGVIDSAAEALSSW